MSVLIKGMTMPTSCGVCPLMRTVEYEEICPLLGEYACQYDRNDDCPLVKLPPHGRLKDADAFLAEQRHLYCENCARRKGMKNGKMKFVYDIGDAPCRACGYGDVLDDIEDAPTIIQAEEGET